MSFWNAFSIPGRSIERADEVEAGLDDMLNATGAFLLHVAIDDAHNVWPLVPPGAANHDMMDEVDIPIWSTIWC